MVEAPPDQRSHVYRSQCDAWLAVVLGLTILSLGLATISLLLSPGPLLGRLIPALLLFAAGGFVLWIWFGTSYTLTDQLLRIRSGPFRWRISLRAITAVEPTRNPLSSPALSLTRLRVRSRGSALGVMIAPVRRDEFLEDLVQRAPGLVRDGDRLTRARPGP